MLVKRLARSEPAPIFDAVRGDGGPRGRLRLTPDVASQLLEDDQDLAVRRVLEDAIAGTPSTRLEAGQSVERVLVHSSNPGEMILRSFN